MAPKKGKAEKKSKKAEDSELHVDKATAARNRVIFNVTRQRITGARQQAGKKLKINFSQAATFVVGAIKYVRAANKFVQEYHEGLDRRRLREEIENKLDEHLLSLGEQAAGAVRDKAKLMDDLTSAVKPVVRSLRVKTCLYGKNEYVPLPDDILALVNEITASVARIGTFSDHVLAELQTLKRMGLEDRFGQASKIQAQLTKAGVGINAAPMAPAGWSTTSDLNALQSRLLNIATSQVAEQHTSRDGRRSSVTSTNSIKASLTGRRKSSPEVRASLGSEKGEDHAKSALKKVMNAVGILKNLRSERKGLKKLLGKTIKRSDKEGEGTSSSDSSSISSNESNGEEAKQRRERRRRRKMRKERSQRSQKSDGVSEPASPTSARRLVGQADPPDVDPKRTRTQHAAHDHANADARVAITLHKVAIDKDVLGSDGEAEDDAFDEEGSTGAQALEASDNASPQVRKSLMPAAVVSAMKEFSVGGDEGGGLPPKSGCGLLPPVDKDNLYGNKRARKWMEKFEKLKKSSDWSAPPPSRAPSKDAPATPTTPQPEPPQGDAAKRDLYETGFSGFYRAAHALREACREPPAEVVPAVKDLSLSQGDSDMQLLRMDRASSMENSMKALASCPTAHDASAAEKELTAAQLAERQRKLREAVRISSWKTAREELSEQKVAELEERMQLAEEAVNRLKPQLEACMMEHHSMDSQAHAVLHQSLERRLRELSEMRRRLGLARSPDATIASRLPTVQSPLPLTVPMTPHLLTAERFRPEHAQPPPSLEELMRKSKARLPRLEVIADYTGPFARLTVPGPRVRGVEGGLHKARKVRNKHIQVWHWSGVDLDEGDNIVPCLLPEVPAVETLPPLVAPPARPAPQSGSSLELRRELS